MGELQNNDAIQLFEDKKIRTAWDEEQEEWYFSIVDVIAVLTDQKTPRSASTYWAVLKKRLKDEGANELLTNCKQLKMTAADGKKAFDRCCKHRTAFAYHPVHSLTKSRTVQGMAGNGGSRAYRGNH